VPDSSRQIQGYAKLFRDKLLAYLLSTLQRRIKKYSEIGKTGKKVRLATGKVSALHPYEKKDLILTNVKTFEGIEEHGMIVTIYSGKKVLSTLRLEK